jgi:photosystem II stability/assembly factor-like uncharacterized protein
VDINEKKGGFMRVKNHFAAFILILCFVFLFTEAFGSDQESFSEDLLKVFKYRALGPARQGSRILDIIVPESQPYTFFVSLASGGLWKTVNNGTTFAPLFKNPGKMPIGDTAVALSNPDIIWVGTGTAASGRISLLGDGVYKTVDGGKTWKHMGLKETRHIGRIVIHPTNPDIVYVAALGFHFSFNEERGLYKTTDGGKTWKKSLYISDKVGVVEVAMHPQNPDVLYAASYDKWRNAWHFEEAGPESGIYKTTDGGKTWTKLSAGLPTGKLGRIGVDIYLRNPEIVYATIDNWNMRPPTKEEVEQARRRGVERPETRIGGEVYRSDDAGKTWTKMNSQKDRIGGGKWYGQIRIDPNDDKVIYVQSTVLFKSTDGGKKWTRNTARSVHVDHHGLWIDPKNSDHIILGNDGGLAITYDGGKTWDQYENLPGAQFYAIGVDMEEPYNIYGGTQDTGSVKIPSNGLTGRITRDDWVMVGGGDGMYNQPDPNNSRWLYNEAQFGSIQRVDQKLGIRKNIRPPRKEGEPTRRFNWNCPIRISPHNSQIIYFGSSVIHRSMNRGEDWQDISPDLTTNDPEKLKGNIEHCTITTISESPVTPGIIWVGTDDGKIQLTQNGGGTWTDLTPSLSQAGAPEDYWVSRVFASHFEDGTAYAVKTGFQRDDFTPLVFKTTDYGKTWISIAGNLPDEIIYVIFEDRKNPNLLFVGTDIGVFVTLDGGKKWMSMKNNIPTNPIHDLLIHPRENDLVVGTYGWGIYVTDISPLQELNEKVTAEEVHLFEVEPKIQLRYTWEGGLFGNRHFNAPNETYGLAIYYYLKNAVKEDVKIIITDPYGKELNSLKGSKKAGLNKVVWSMQRKLTPEEVERIRERGGRVSSRSGQPVLPGEYVVILQVGGKKLSQKALVRPMPDAE